MDLREEVKHIQDLEKKYSQTKKDIDDKIKSVRRRILNGESTGDEISDFIAVVRGSIEDESHYRQIKERLKEQEGQQVLVVTEEVARQYSRGTIGRHYVDVKTRLELGVLTSGLEFAIEDPDKINILRDPPMSEKPRLILPSESYVLKEPDSEEWELAKGPIQIDYSDLENFNPDGKRTEPAPQLFDHDQDANTTRILLISVGYKNILDYFAPQRQRIVFEDEFESYVKALKLLGIENSEIIKSSRIKYVDKIFD